MRGNRKERPKRATEERERPKREGDRSMPLILKVESLILLQKRQIMNQVVIDLWPVITGSVLTAVFSAAGMYIGFVHRLRTKVAVMEVEVVELKRRVEGHSRKQDDIMSAINGIRNDMNEKLNQITVDIAKIKTTLTIIEPKKEV